MSLNDTMTNLANTIRSKSLTKDKMSLADMTSVINDSLELKINTTQNMLYSPNDFNDSHWSNDLKNQVGQDTALGPHYFWRTPEQHNNYLSQLIEGSNLNDVYAWKFYAKADYVGDKAHSELFRSVSATDFTLSDKWEAYYLLGTVSALPSFNKEVVYFGSVDSNKGKIYIADPVLVKIEK